MQRQNIVERALLPVLLCIIRVTGKSARSTVLFLTLLTTAKAEPLIAGAERFPDHAGEILYNDLGCVRCHEGRGWPGPTLVDLPKRIHYDYLLTFLKNPEHNRMPALFDALPDDAIRDVAAYLSTLSGDLKFKPQRHANAERGSALYHEIGCVACHAQTPDFKPARPISPFAVPLPDLKKKTSLLALTDFLLNTGKYRSTPRMPLFPMDQQEALDIAAHLLDFQSSDPREAKDVKPWPKATEDMIRRGKSRVQELNCAACHKLPDINAKVGKPISDPNAQCGTARYDLTESQKQSLTKFVGKDPGMPLPDDFDTLARLNCYACHERNRKGGPTDLTNPFFAGDPSLGDSGRLPPPLTDVGMKMKPEVMESILLGNPHSQVRPYLKTRMPVFPQTFASSLSQLFFHDPHLTPIAKVDDLEAGRKLLGTNGGVNCITCHRWGDQPSLGIQGPDISDLDKRMTPEWFRRYLLDPAAYRPGTLMPALWPDGHSSVKDILGGDTEKQIGAIWAFIRGGEGLPEGFPDKSTGQFELVPTDRPIIQRTFLEGVGTHAILVGFPGGINLVYDGKTAQPALIWHGRFFDAYNTWFSRFAPFEKLLEEIIMPFPNKPTPGKFLGYEIDEKGNPTFLSLRDGKRSSEHFEIVAGELVYTIDGKSTKPTIK
jgi:mono/diheme cytochrome c family protein